VTLRYAFDQSTDWLETTIASQTLSTRTIIDCGLLETFQPAIIRMYVTGYDESGKQICSIGSAENPYVTLMDINEQLHGDVDPERPLQRCGICEPWESGGESCYCSAPCEIARKYDENAQRILVGDSSPPPCQLLEVDKTINERK